MPQRKVGRPTKLTPEVQDKIVSAIRVGNYIDVAAQYAGIHKDTLYHWMQLAHDEDANGPHRQFSDAIKAALAQSEVEGVARITSAARENWQAMAWRLERRFPDRWGRNDRVRVDANVRLETKDDLLAEGTALGLTEADIFGS